MQPGQVGLGGVELAQRLFFAFAMFEDACGFLDEPAPVLGRSVQDGVELALPDDDVHLAPDAGVTEELLDIEKAAGLAVDRVVGAAVAKHRPRNGYLGVVDGQSPVCIVDREHDLGAPEGCPTRCAREDDVFHLAATKGLGSLLTHHPGQRVDHVGLAGTVWSDDTGDARLELQGCRGGKGLEPPQRQALEIHRCCSSARIGDVRAVGRDLGEDQARAYPATRTGGLRRADDAAARIRSLLVRRLAGRRGTSQHRRPQRRRRELRENGCALRPAGLRSARATDLSRSLRA